MNQTATITSILFFSIGSIFSTPQTWEQWRGPTRDGRILDQETKWPTGLSGIKKLWRKDLSEGYSSPIVTPECIFTVETKNKSEE